MVVSVCFSARGTTMRYCEAVGKVLGTQKVLNWVRKEDRVPLSLSEKDILIFACPVYGGFIPSVCRDSIDLLKGQFTPALILAVYGNRHYDNALVQMQCLLEERGFAVKAAAALVAEHSIFPSVARGRPDGNDLLQAEEFAFCASRCLTSKQKISLPGDRNADSHSFKGAAFHPAADGQCTHCMKCVSVCPLGAISQDSPETCLEDLCISCGACIEACPCGARKHRNAEYGAAQAAFAMKYSARRENEFFFSGTD